jgi:hypothetical protein
VIFSCDGETQASLHYLNCFRKVEAYAKINKQRVGAKSKNVVGSIKIEKR